MLFECFLAGSYCVLEVLLEVVRHHKCMNLSQPCNVWLWLHILVIVTFFGPDVITTRLKISPQYSSSRRFKMLILFHGISLWSWVCFGVHISGLYEIHVCLRNYKKWAHTNAYTFSMRCHSCWHFWIHFVYAYFSKTKNITGRLTYKL